MRTHRALLLLAPALVLGIAACNIGAPAVTDDSRKLSGATQEQRVSLPGVDFAVDVPTELGSPSDDSRTGSDCPTNRVVFGGSTTPVGSRDHDPKLFFGATTHACPGARSLNGSFPTWASVRDLPQDRVQLAVHEPVASAYRFRLDYTQCTNECYDRTYDVVFVTLVGTNSTFWMQSSDLEIAAVDKILGSLRLA